MIRKCFVMIGVAIALAISVGDNTPRGLANHNPGNVIKTDTHWVGEVSCSDPYFECFSSSHYGLRAMAIILYHYKSVYNDDTLYDVLYRWMPPNENPTEAILLNVMGYVCNDRDSISLPSLMEVIILIENGVQPFSTSDIYNALPNDSYRKVRFYCYSVNT